MVWVRGGRPLVEESPRAATCSTLRQPDACAWRTGRAERPRVRSLRRHRVERHQGSRPERLGAGLHRAGRRRRRPGHRLSVGPSRAQGPLPRLERRRAPTTTTTGTTRSTPAAASAAPTRRSRATTTATARTRWARWSATTAARQPDRRGARREVDRLPQHGPGRRHAGDVHRVLQWFLAPTDLERARTRDPTKAPHVINNSWGCPRARAAPIPTCCRRWSRALRAAGIAVVVSAGNAGAAARRSTDPPAIYDASFSVGATDISDNDRGLLEPRPGHGRRQQPPEAGRLGAGSQRALERAGQSATRVSAERAWRVRTRVGIVALLLSAHPEPLGPPGRDRGVHDRRPRSRATTSESCGGMPGDEIPNNTYGWGRADALAASIDPARTSRSRRPTLRTRASWPR